MRATPASPRLPLHSVPGLAAVVALHIGILGVLARPGELPAETPPAVLTVSLLAPPPAARQEPVEPLPVPPARPRAAIQPPQPAPLLSASPLPQPPPTPTPTLEPAPAPATVANAALNSEAPLTVVAARFDADYLRNPAPAYPPLSRRIGEEGKVVLRVFVGADGRPGQIEVKTSSSSPRLDQAAQDAVRRWQFVPARRGEETVPAWVLVPIVFNLKG